MPSHSTLLPAALGHEYDGFQTKLDERFCDTVGSTLTASWKLHASCGSSSWPAWPRNMPGMCTCAQNPGSLRMGEGEHSMSKPCRGCMSVSLFLFLMHMLHHEWGWGGGPEKQTNKKPETSVKRL